MKALKTETVDRFIWGKLGERWVSSFWDLGNEHWRKYLSIRYSLYVPWSSNVGAVKENNCLWNCTILASICDLLESTDTSWFYCSLLKTTPSGIIQLVEPVMLQKLKLWLSGCLLNVFQIACNSYNNLFLVFVFIKFRQTASRPWRNHLSPPSLLGSRYNRRLFGMTE